HRDLELTDVPVGDRARDLLDLEPVDVANGLAGARDAVPYRLVDALARRPDDLGQPVGRLLVVGHIPSRSWWRGAEAARLVEPNLELIGSMINLDDPRHARLRRIVSASFTPKMIKTFEDQVQVGADGIVDNVIDKGECDFVTEVAARLPLKIICDMMGIPESD